MLCGRGGKLKTMIEEKLKRRLEELHKQEDAYNKEMSKICWEIKQLEKRKEKLSKQVSGNMKLRNRLLFPEKFCFISDGFGSTWSIFCPTCKKPKMQIVRSGKVQCSKCG